MYRNETISTKIRPIKKLCIIEKDDHENLISIIKHFSSEIGGFFNLILTNDEDLFSKNTIEFIKNHDPDIVINYSKIDDKSLKSNFKTLVVDGKNNSFDYNRFSIPLFILDNFFDFSKYGFDNAVKKIYTSFDEKKDSNNLMYHLNYGLIKNDTRYEDEAFFENVELVNLDSISTFFEIAQKQTNSLLFLFRGLSRSQESIDIWSIDFNKEQYYKKKPTVIFGDCNNINSMIYFWNVRATYPYNVNIWLPLELFDEYKKDLKNFSNYCIFAENSVKEFKRKINETNKDLTEIDNSKYYFNNIKMEWNSFKHIQNVSILNNKFRIKHPSEKFFSTYGLNINLVLEITGLEDLFLPNSLKLGELFTNSSDFSIDSHNFSRISSNGLSVRFSNFVPLNNEPYVAKLKIPDVKSIFETFFEEHELELKETNGTQITNQLINLIGGFEKIDILRDKNIFDFLVRLTPKRLERLIQKVTKDVGDNIEIEQIVELIEKNLDEINTISSNTIVETKNLLSYAPNIGKEKSDFYSIIQQLYEMNVLLRGKSFKCSSCNSLLWYPLTSITNEMKCYCCNNSINIPIFSKKNILDDSFRLNELVANAVDQGALPVLLTTSIIFNQKFAGKRFIFDSDIYEKIDLLAEIDIIFTFGKKIGLAEVKADRGFDIKQIDKLLNVARIVNADLVLFSTLKSCESQEINDLISHIKTKNLDIPAFILTKESLFEKNVVDLSKYFEVNDNKFQNGPILIKSD